MADQNILYNRYKNIANLNPQIINKNIFPLKENIVSNWCVTPLIEITLRNTYFLRTLISN